ncbi:MAG: division/cell wall cluster transcriptional repressor MraZ [Ignavibacteriae bacterium]|nr:division/cell wall cluster transcriptional repressor MraZ [Ignavibacteriota bacterium]
MSSFKGSFEYSVDSKGRVNIPLRLRKYLSAEANATFTITRGFERSVFVYPQDEWATVERSIRELSPSEARERFFMRVLLQHATESQLDGQSRITIPKGLLEHAGIETEVMILGVLNHIELWNPALYKEYLKSQQESYEDVAQAILKKPTRQ